MFKPIKRLLVAVTAILALTAPSVAYAALIQPDGFGGSSTSVQARSSIAELQAAERQLRLGQLQAAVAPPFAAQGDRSTTASRVQAAGPSSKVGFRWADAGIGAAGMLALVGIGAGAAVVIRRRVHEPLTS